VVIFGLALIFVIFGIWALGRRVRLLAQSAAVAAQQRVVARAARSVGLGSRRVAQQPVVLVRSKAATSVSEARARGASADLASAVWLAVGVAARVGEVGARVAAFTALDDAVTAHSRRRHDARGRRNTRACCRWRTGRRWRTGCRWCRRAGRCCGRCHRWCRHNKGGRH